MEAIAASEEFDVTIVGAGPAGLAAAVTLAGYGVKTLLIERHEEVSNLPRATVASTGTMELLRRWGLERAAWKRSLDVEWTAWACTSMADAACGEEVEVGMPTRSQAALISPTRPACLSQDALEPLLEGHLRASRSVTVDRGSELLAIEAGPDGHELAISDHRGTARILTRYLIGADGIRSTVRSLLGISTTGEQRLESRVGVLFRAPIWELAGPHRHGIYFLTGEPANRALIPAGPGDRWIFGSGDRTGVPGEGKAVEQIREAAGDRHLAVEIERIAPTTYGTALADRFRCGGAFLVGDAAHRVTPRGGTGLNTAVRDGFDIGWKLAWVLRGWAGQELLDTYETERRPIAEYNVERSMRPDGSVLGTGLGLSADLGGRIPHVWTGRGGSPVSTLDLLGPGLTVLAGPDWTGTFDSRAPFRIERLDPIATHALGLSPSGALVVRPDGRPVELRGGSEVIEAGETVSLVRNTTPLPTPSVERV